MGEDRDQQVLHYERATQRPSRRPDVLFGSLAAGCYGLLTLSWIVVVLQSVQWDKRSPLMAALALGLWPAGVVLATLGVLFDRRRQWVSSAALIANIIAPLIVFAVALLIRRVAG